MPNPFYNREERRVRALVRIVLHGAIFIVLVSFAVLLVSPIALAGYDAPPTSEEIAMDSAFTALATVASLVVMTFLLWLMARFVDRRDFSDYGLWITERTWARDLGFGLVLGVALQGLIFLFQWVVGWIEITGTFVASRGTFATAILLPVVIYICVGIYEE
ncbi:MAG: CPBP family intramembrane glutamate endopeptidase, partial [Chloroflexota bacterium]